MRFRTLTTGLLAALLLVGTALPAFADHTHVLVLGNGRCVILAESGNEKYVQLPHQEDLPENRRHPLHTNVHLGQAGTRGGQEVIFVKDSPGDLANCSSYVNG